MDNEFLDINKESKSKMYIIVGILYFFVILFSVLLFFGIKNQNRVVKENIKENNSNRYEKDTNSKISEENIPDNKIDKKTDNIFENKTNNNDRINPKDNNIEKDYENILNQI